MAMLLGKKIGMTQVYNDQGKMIPVTVLQAGPCTVTQVKTPDSDGYAALQLGYDDVKASRILKPAQGHAQKANGGWGLRIHRNTPRAIRLTSLRLRKSNMSM